MDTKSIASEIVELKNRLEEIERQSDVADEERKRLQDRRRHLQDQLSTHGAGKRVAQDEPAHLDDVHYVPPA